MPRAEQAVAVRIAEWPNDAQAAACLMIDDLTDGWIDEAGSGVPLGRNDWGAGLDAPGSAFRFLSDGILGEFPEIRTTFFVPVDRLEDIRPARVRFEFRPIDRRPEFVRFLRDLDADPRFELAYHGKEHGLPGATPADYVPEFESYDSVAEAVSALRAGEQIWKGVFDRSPEGGKYPAYGRGAHGDAAIDVAGFAWWCRRWDRDLATDADPAAFRPRMFGERGVVDVPSTLHGGFMTPPKLREVGPKFVPWVTLMRLRAHRWLDAQIDALLASRSVISVQEHISPSRPDGLTQTPNLFDDTRTLRHVFRRLREHAIWHASCGEIAAYFRARELTRVQVRSEQVFEVRRDSDDGPWAPLSLILNGRDFGDGVALRGPRGTLLAPVSRRPGACTAVTEPLALEAGRYQIL